MQPVFMKMVMREITLEMKQMNTDPLVTKCIDATSLAARESILRIRRAEPLGSQADYYARYKVDIGTLDDTGNQPRAVRSIVVNISASSGIASIEQSSEIPDLV